MATAAPPNDLARYLVAIEELQTAEYCYRMKETNFRQKPKDDILLKPKLQIINSMLNSSGGILCLVSNKPELEPFVDNWELGFKAQLNIVFSDQILNNNIDFTGEGSPIHTLHIFVSRAADLVTLDYGLFIRKNTETKKVTDILTAQRTITATSSSLFPLSYHWVYNEAPNVKEQHNVEFKHWNTKSSAETIERFQKETRVHKCMMALANVPTGGYILLGIEESKPTQGGSCYVTKGIILEMKHETDFTEAVRCKFQTFQNNNPTIWGNNGVSPTQGDHWDVTYHTVSNCPSRERRVVIILEIRHCPGGFFCYEPESYEMSEEGVISQILFDDWKKRILHSFIDAPSDHLGSANTLYTCQGVPRHGVPHVSPRNVSDSTGDKILSESVKQTDLIDATLAKLDKLSWSEHTSDWRKNLHFYDSTNRRHERRAIERLLKTGQPTVFIPEEKIILSSFKNDTEIQTINKCISFVKNKHNDSKSIAIASKNSTKSFTASKDAFDQRLNILSADENSQVCLTVSSIDADTELALLSFIREAGRRLKRKIIEMYLEIGLSIPKIHVQTTAITPSIQPKPSFLDRQCLSFVSSIQLSWKALQEALGYIILRGESTVSVKNRLGNEILVQLTIDQMAQILGTELSRFSLIEGPPGSGKTLLALYLCSLFGKDNTLVLCLTPGLKAFYDSQGVCQTYLVPNEEALEELLCGRDHFDKRCVIIDDCHNLMCKKTSWRLLFQDIWLQQNAHLILLADNKIQNFVHSDSKHHIRDALDIISRYSRETCFTKNLSVVHRTSHKVTSFITSHFRDYVVPCAHKEEGDEVEVIKVPSLSENGVHNGLIVVVKDLIQPEKVLAGNQYSYDSKDVAILVDGDDAETNITMYKRLLPLHLNVVAHGADTYPVQGLTIDQLDRFCGLDAKVVILVLPNSIFNETEGDASNIRNMANPRFKAFVASRAIYRVIFVTDATFNHHTAAHMNMDNIPETSVHEIPHPVNSKIRSPLNEDSPPPTTDQWLKSNRLVFRDEYHQNVFDVMFLSMGSLLYIAGDTAMDTGVSIFSSNRRLYLLNLEDIQPPVPVLTQFTDVTAVSVDSRTHTLAVSDRTARCVTLYKWEGNGNGIDWIYQRTYREQHVAGLAILGQSIVCVRVTRLCMLGEDGQEIWRTSLPFTTSNYQPYVCVDSTTQKIIVSNPNACLVSVYDSHGNVVTTLPTYQIQLPRGVCVTSGGRILVADLLTHTVSMFCANDISVRRVLKTDVEPYSISLYHDRYLVIGSLDKGWLLYDLQWDEQ